MVVDGILTLNNLLKESVNNNFNNNNNYKTLELNTLANVFEKISDMLSHCPVIETLPASNSSLKSNEFFEYFYNPAIRID